MTPEDLARIHARAMIVPPAWSAPTFEGFLAARGCVLATSDTGFALGRVVLDEAELLTLAVDPDARRRGEGRKCLLGFEKKAVEIGAIRVFLEVAVTNDAARGLYAGAGYREAGLRRAYYPACDGHPIDALVMSKILV